MSIPGFPCIHNSCRSPIRLLRRILYNRKTTERRDPSSSPSTTKDLFHLHSADTRIAPAHSTSSLRITQVPHKNKWRYPLKRHRIRNHCRSWIFSQRVLPCAMFLKWGQSLLSCRRPIFCPAIRVSKRCPVPQQAVSPARALMCLALPCLVCQVGSSTRHLQLSQISRLP